MLIDTKIEGEREAVEEEEEEMGGLMSGGRLRGGGRWERRGRGGR